MILFPFFFFFWGKFASNNSKYNCTRQVTWSFALLSQDKDDDWEGGESDEVNSDDDEVGISDEDEEYYRKPQGKQKNRGGHSVKSTRVVRSLATSARRKRGRTSYEEEESSEHDSENESDEDFGNKPRRVANLRLKNSGRSSATSVSGRNSEIRTSSRRSVRKVSYAESEESEEIDDSKQKKGQKVLSFPCILRFSVYLLSELLLVDVFYSLNLNFFTFVP